MLRQSPHSKRQPNRQRDFRPSLERICAQKKWSFDNAKQRGMAFEDWCFNHFAERYPAAENDPDECIIMGDDAEIDIFFESKEKEEIYILQCKHQKIAQSDLIPEGEVKSFFSNYALLKDRKYLDGRKTKNPKLEELAVEFEHWIKRGYGIYFIFISSGTASDKISALVDRFNRDHVNSNVKFDVWDINSLKDEYVSSKSIEEKYPEDVTFTLANNNFMIRYADSDKAGQALILVKLTAVKHATRETGIASALIKTNNTQNTLRVPERSDT